VLYGILLGVLTFCFRIFGNSVEGVSYAIIISNLLVPMIEMITKPRSFGEGYEKKPLSENRGWLAPVVLDEEGKPVPEKKEDKKERPLRIVISICLIAVISGALLGTVYAITKKPIADTAEKKKQESFRTVMPKADSYKELEEDSEWTDYDLSGKGSAMEQLNAELAEVGYDKVTLESRTDAFTSDGTKVGKIWIITSHEGYAGDIRMAIGVTEGKVTGITMLSIGETTGLGMEARDNPAFTKQYEGKLVETFTVVKNSPAEESEIQAITGATITSKAVTNAVNAVLFVDRMSEDHIEGGADHE
jgi:RnfABCDGE-type electron transport complex G subunit